MLCIRGIAIDANGEMGRLEGKEFLFLFPPSKRGWGKQLAQIRKGTKESKGPIKEEKLSLSILELLSNIQNSGFAFTFVGYF